MKENNGILCHSDGCHKEGQPLSFTTKDCHHSTVQGEDTDPLTLQKLDTDDIWNSPELKHSTEVDGCVKGNETKNQVSLLEDQSGSLKHLQNERDEDSLTASELFQPDSHLYTDKEINYPVVKDICVDEGVPVEDKGLIKRQMNEHATLSVSVPSNECRHDKISEECDPFAGGCVSKDATISEDSTLSGETIHNTPKKIENDVLEEENQSPSMEATAERFSALSKAEDLYKNSAESELLQSHKFENGTATFDFSSPNLPTAESRVKCAETVEASLNSDIVMNQEEGNSKVLPPTSLIEDANMAGKIEDVCEESVVNTPNRNSNNPFIDSEVPGSNTGGNSKNFSEETVVNQTKENSNNPFAFDEVESSSVEQSSGNIHQSHIMNHENGNFNPFEYSQFDSTNTSMDTENVHQPPIPNPFSRNSKNPFSSMDLDHDTQKMTNPFADDEVQSSSTPGAIQNIHRQPEVKQNEGHSSNPFATSEVPTNCTDAIATNMNENPIKTETRAVSDGHLSAIRHNQSATSVEPQDLPNGEGPSLSVSINNHDQFGIGESSFSAAGPPSGLITYTGPIAYSGSTSLRSDSSATSARSFAFPVMQNEWNSSPERMRKADRRHFRKHGGWKQGILCCKF